MVLTRSSTRKNISLDVEQPTTSNNSIYSPLSCSSPNNHLRVMENSNMNNQVFNYPIVNDNVKLPPFWISCPQAWFIQTEIQFNIKQITDDTTKYQHVIIALPQEVIIKILDVLQKPPTLNKYEFLKNTLCERFSLSEEKRLEQLFSDKQIGDRRPSEFYRDMSNVAGSVSLIGNDLLYKLWLRKLPKELQVHLTSSNLENLDDKIKLADKIWDVLSKNQIYSINSNCNNQDIIQQFSTITSQICQNLDKLSLEVSELRSSRQRNMSYPNYRRKSRSRSRQKFEKCWYHFKFGSNAHKCIPPCNFTSNDTNLN
ncbi:uncharacterized protein LOC135950819 [Calliphora vicina]|uniref:uncharacterized protein LOC135950819 n=1 Tax=Calliphora vicina TaxID=7373 RepID=UPI00325AF42E